MVGQSFLEGFGRNWWGLLLRGILAILFGVMAFVTPGLTLLTLALVYGAYALLDGIVSIWFGASSRAWGLVVFGLLGVGIGLYTLYVPWGTAIALLYMIGAWAVLRGVFEVVTAIQLRKEIDNEWMLILSGVVSVLFGLLVLIAPGAGALGLVWAIAAYSIVFGISFVALAFRLRKHKHEPAQA